MPLIKEAFFKTKKIILTFRTQSEMIEKIESEWLNSSDLKSAEKKEKATLKHLSWFQKVKLEDKEYFIDKNNIPLKLKSIVPEEKTSHDTVLAILGFSILPCLIFPVVVYELVKNHLNKLKVQKEKSIYCKNMYDNLVGLGLSFILSNLILGIILLATKSLNLYIGIVILNLIFGFINMKSKDIYNNIDNFEIEDFSLLSHTSSTSSVEERISNMKSREILTNSPELRDIEKNKDDIDELLNNVEEEDDKIIKLEKNSPVSLKKYL